MNTQPKQGEIKLAVRVIYEKDDHGCPCIAIRDSSRIIVHDLGAKGNPLAEETAQAIAHALNSREELLSAAQGAYDLLCSLRAEQTAPKTLKQLRAVLAKAKGEKI